MNADGYVRMWAPRSRKRVETVGKRRSKQIRRPILRPVLSAPEDEEEEEDEGKANGGRTVLPGDVVEDSRRVEGPEKEEIEEGLRGRSVSKRCSFS